MIKLLFDIGAHEGKFSTELLNQNLVENVILVEANPITFTRLQKNMIPYQNTTVLNYGVSDGAKSDDILYISSGKSELCSMNYNWVSNGRFSEMGPFPGLGKFNSTCNVKTITLDQLIDYYGIPDFIKIDVEGHEYHVISGLTKYIPKICFEWHVEIIENVEKCLNYLKKLGYTEFGIIKHNYIGDIIYVEPEKYHCDLETFYSDLYLYEENYWNPAWGMIWCK